MKEVVAVGIKEQVLEVNERENVYVHVGVCVCMCVRVCLCLHVYVCLSVRSGLFEEITFKLICA